MHSRYLLHSRTCTCFVLNRLLQSKSFLTGKSQTKIKAEENLKNSQGKLHSSPCTQVLLENGENVLFQPLPGIIPSLHRKGHFSPQNNCEWLCSPKDNTAWAPEQLPAEGEIWSQIWHIRAEGKTKSGKKRKGLKEILVLCPLPVENHQGIFNLLPSIFHEKLCSPRKSLALSQALVYSYNQSWRPQAAEGTAPSCLGTQSKIPNEAGWFPQDAKQQQASFSQKQLQNQNQLIA